MDSKQTTKFLERILGVYPNFNPAPDRLKIWFKEWESQLKNIDYDIANNRLSKHISEKPYVPAISDIVCAEKLKNKRWEEPETVGPAAIINGGYRTIYDESDLN